MKNITPCCESLRNLTYHFGKMTTSAARESDMNKSTLGYLFVLTDATMIAPENHKKNIKATIYQCSMLYCCFSVYCHHISRDDSNDCEKGTNDDSRKKKKKKKNILRAKRIS